MGLAKHATIENTALLRSLQASFRSAHVSCVLSHKQVAQHCSSLLPLYNKQEQEILPTCCNRSSAADRQKLLQWRAVCAHHFWKLFCQVRSVLAISGYASSMCRIWKPRNCLSSLWAFVQEWVRNLKANSIQPVFANPARQVQRLMEAAQLPQIIGEEFISVRIHDAVTYCQVCIAPSLACLQ